MGLTETILPLAALIYSPSAVPRNESPPVPVLAQERWGPSLFIRCPLRCPEAGAVYSGHLRPVQDGYGGWEPTAMVA